MIHSKWDTANIGIFADDMHETDNPIFRLILGCNIHSLDMQTIENSMSKDFRENILTFAMNFVLDSNYMHIGYDIIICIGIKYLIVLVVHNKWHLEKSSRPL